MFGGCWCIGFHAERNTPGGYDARRQLKKDKVRHGATHAALVMSGQTCTGWAQFGSPAELPFIKHRKAYDAAGQPLPTGGSPAFSSAAHTGAVASRRWHGMARCR